MLSQWLSASATSSLSFPAGSAQGGGVLPLCSVSEELLLHFTSFLGILGTLRRISCNRDADRALLSASGTGESCGSKFGLVAGPASAAGSEVREWCRCGGQSEGAGRWEGTSGLAPMSLARSSSLSMGRASFRWRSKLAMLMLDTLGSLCCVLLAWNQNQRPIRLDHRRSINGRGFALLGNACLESEPKTC